jgi:hypothetical protein
MASALLSDRVAEIADPDHPRVGNRFNSASAVTTVVADFVLIRMPRFT